MKIRSLLFCILALLFVSGIMAQERKGTTSDPGSRSKNSLNVSPLSGGSTAQEMVENILGVGVTFSNVQYTGSTIASGLFSGGVAAGININDGIILSSGAAENAIGPNNSTGISQQNNVAGDPDLNSLGFQTNDASVLEFDFIPETNNLSFSFVMGSEEYPEYINSYPDVFAFFVNGVNIAFVPGTTIPVSIGTINHEQNSEYYLSNEPTVFDIQCDGFTVEFQLFATVIPNQINHIKIAVADANDYSLDTWIFLKSSSFVGINLPPVALGFPAIQPVELIVGDFFNLIFNFNSPEPGQTTNTVVNDFGLSGFNYTVVPGNICQISLSLLATLNNVGNHTVQFIATDNGIPAASTTVTLTFNITNPLPNIVVNPLSLSESLYPNETSTKMLTISNTGDADLNFDLDDIETSKHLKIKSIRPSGNGDNPDDFLNYLNNRAKDGSKLVSWLGENPASGVIPAGTSVDVEIAFNAAGLSADMYNAQILVNSNDPDQPQIIVPVSLEVLGTNCVHFTTDDNENNALQGIPDFDMDNYLFNDDPITPIEFNIVIQETIIESAQLSLYAYDVDETGAPGYLPELDEIYVNGNFVGSLTGANDEWSTTVLNINPAFLIPGPNANNLIEVFVDVLNPETNSVWAVQIDWGQLIINNCMSDNAYIRDVELDKDFYLPGEIVSITTEVDTYLPSMNVIVETNLLNQDMTNVAGTSNPIFIQLNNDEPLTVALPLPADALMGATYYAQVIVYNAATYLQEDLALIPFTIIDENVVYNCMEPGWQLISSFVIPSSPAVEDVMEDLVLNEALVIMLSKNGIYWPVQNINTIGSWDVYSGYKIKMSKPDCLLIDGEMPLNKTVNLGIGTNFMPVLDNQNVDANDIFSQISGKLIFAFDLQSSLIFWPAGGIYTLQTLEPGKAYMVSLSSSGSITYPDSKGIEPLNNNKAHIVKGSPWVITNTGSQHIISVYQSASQDLKTGDIIGAFNSNGLCVGVSQYTGETVNIPLIVYGDDFTTSEIDGMIENEVLTFKIYDAGSKVAYEVFPSYDLSMPNTGNYAENGLSAITGLKSSTSISEQGFENVRIYPNPNNGEFTVVGINETLGLSVLNTAGQTLLNLKANSDTNVDLTGFSKGIYYLKLVSGNSVKIEKIIVR